MVSGSEDQSDRSGTKIGRHNGQTYFIKKEVQGFRKGRGGTGKEVKIMLRRTEERRQ